MDKCLPVSSSISCAIFQNISDAIAWLVKATTDKELINYLDDFLFVAMMKIWCEWQLNIFLDICQTIGMPISIEKTVRACTQLVFLGLLVDGEKQLVMIPTKKIEKALTLIREFLQKGKKKMTLRRMQQLCSFLNFLCRAVQPGRVFTRRLYPAATKNLKPHHHLKITQEMKNDLLVWEEFLAHPSVFCRPFTDFSLTKDATQLQFFTDASRNFSLGCRGHYGNEWFFVGWDEKFMQINQPSIAYLELYALVVGIILWIKNFKNSKIQVFCDNMGVVSMVNNTSSCKNCMILLRMLVLHSLIWNVKVRAKFVSTKANAKADAISCCKFKLFHRLTNYQAKSLPLAVPECMDPMAKLWLK